MKSFWHRIKLRNKIVLMGVSFILLFALTVMIYFIPSIEDVSMDKKRRELKDIVNITASLMDALIFESENGRISEFEAESKAIYYSGKFRYGADNTDTVWLIKSDGSIYSMPYREDLVGKKISSLPATGKRNVYSEMIELCMKNGEGYIEYQAQYKSEITKKVPVISYVRYYKPFDMIIGSSVYIDDVKSEIFSLYVRTALATFIIMAAAIALLFLFAQRIVKPIKDIVEGLSSSDLNTELHTEYRDETGLMVSYFNDFVKNIRNLIIEINETSINLSSSAEELSAISSSFAGKSEKQNNFSIEVMQKVKWITGNVEGVATQIDNEFNKMSNLIQIMDTLSGIIQRIDENTTNAASVIKFITDNAAEGEVSLKKMMKSISNLEDRSKDMNGIVTIINDISDRINLLSLNAAIEAARAGEAGRGFAVVAGEISKLADATSSSISEISRIIMDNERELGDGILHVENTVKVISLIMNGFDGIKKWIEGIAVQIKEQIGTKESVQHEVHEIRIMSDTIRKTTRAQKDSVLEINILMESINSETEAISSGSQELAAGAEEVNAMSENLRAKVSLFKI